MDRIKKLRKECNVKQIEMSLLMDMQNGNYANIENGKYIPNNLEALKKKAVKILMPVLIAKIMNTRDELNRLEWLSTQFK